MTGVEIKRGRRVLHRSRNLRGLLDHARRAGPPVCVTLRRVGPMSALQPFRMVATFPDGSQGFAAWADWRVAGDWLRARRSWGRPQATTGPAGDGPQVSGVDGFVNRALGLAGAR